MSRWSIFKNKDLKFHREILRETVSINIMKLKKYLNTLSQLLLIYNI